MSFSSERFRPARDADMAAPTAVGGDSLSRSTEWSLATTFVVRFFSFLGNVRVLAAAGKEEKEEGEGEEQKREFEREHV